MVKGLNDCSRQNARSKPSLGAEKLTPAGQKRRFIEAAREAGASEDEAEFDKGSASW